MGFGMKKFTVNFKDCTNIQKMKKFVPDSMGVKTGPFARFNFG
jgi:hypothetical protein